MTVGANETFSQIPITRHWKSDHGCAWWQLWWRLYRVFFLSESCIPRLFLDWILCACIKKGNCRKWTLNSSQGRNGHCFLPSAGKTKWLRTASASADRSLNMNVFFPLRIHTQGKETSVCPCVYLQYVCGCIKGKMNVCACRRTFLYLLYGLICVRVPWVPLGPRGSPLSCWPRSAWLSCSFTCQPKSFTPLRYSMAALLMHGHQSIMHSFIYLKASCPGV